MDGHASAPARHVHGGDERPGVVLGVVALHRVQAVPRLRPADHVHEAVQLAHSGLVPPWWKSEKWCVWSLWVSPHKQTNKQTRPTLKWSHRVIHHRRFRVQRTDVE